MPPKFFRTVRRGKFFGHYEDLSAYGRRQQGLNVRPGQKRRRVDGDRGRGLPDRKRRRFFAPEAAAAEQRGFAANDVQRVFRGFRDRKRVKPIREARLREDQEMAREAAKIEEQWVRVRNAGVAAAEVGKKRLAAHKIQSMVRGWRYRGFVQGKKIEKAVREKQLSERIRNQQPVRVPPLGSGLPPEPRVPVGQKRRREDSDYDREGSRRRPFRGFGDGAPAPRPFRAAQRNARRSVPVTPEVPFRSPPAPQRGAELPRDAPQGNYVPEGGGGTPAGAFRDPPSTGRTARGANATPVRGRMPFTRFKGKHAYKYQTNTRFRGPFDRIHEKNQEPKGFMAFRAKYGPGLVRFGGQAFRTFAHGVQSVVHASNRYGQYKSM